MRTVRRLYFFAVAFVSLEIVLWGLIGLTRSILTAPDVVADNASNLAQALALILVGVPVFILHWWVTQRNAREDMEEHTSGIRAIFLYAVLLSTLIPIVQNLLALIDRTLLEVLKLSRYQAMFGAQQTWGDNLIAIGMNALIAAYFISILRSDWKTIRSQEAFTEIRRIYRYIWVLYGLIMVVAGIQQLLEYIISIQSELTPVLGSAGVNGIVLALVGAPLWFLAWKTVQDGLVEKAERESLLRLGVLYFLSLAGVVTVLFSGGTVIYHLLRVVLGEKLPVSAFLEQVNTPVSIGVSLGVVWAYFGHWLNRTITEAPDAPRRSGMRRLYYYILSAIGLTATFSGLSLLLAFTVDAALGEVLWAETLRPQLAAALATLFAGLPLWWFTWSPMQRDALVKDDSGDHARRSLVRKIYLYLVLFASVVGGMAAAIAVVYNLLVSALGTTPLGFLQQILKSLEVLVLFILMGVYHGLTLGRDGKMAAKALTARHAKFPTLIFEPGDGNFSATILAALTKQMPGLPAAVQPVTEPIPAEARGTVRAVILPTNLALDPPEALRLWLNDFSGSKLVVPYPAPSWFWIGQPAQIPANQTAQAVRQLAEDQEVHPHAGTSGWMVFLYIVAGLFGLQLLLVLVAMGISLFFD